jgi:hypothetical protein
VAIDDTIPTQIVSKLAQTPPMEIFRVQTFYGFTQPRSSILLPKYHTTPTPPHQSIFGTTFYQSY